jgi:mono/diheme cytochrome c family protein
MIAHTLAAVVFCCLALNTTGQVQPAPAVEPGKAVYIQYCLACHQVDGSGVMQLTPPLIKSAFVAGDKSRLITIVLKGLKDVEVNGEVYDNPMPPLDYLTDQDIAHVLTYVRNNFSNKANPVTVEEVRKVRSGK